MQLKLGKVGNKHTQVQAIVYPTCECGAPMASHETWTCHGYKPSRPIENHGTVAFKSSDPLATIFWKLEQFFQTLRLSRMKKGI